MKKTTGVVLVSSVHPPRHGGGNLCELHASILRGTDLMTSVVLASSMSPSRGIDLMMLDERRLGEFRVAIPVERGSILRDSAPLSSMAPD